MAEKFTRKLDHIALCLGDEAAYRSHDGLFDDFTFVHNALPELAMDELQLTTHLVESKLSAPLMVTGMTGGPDEAGRINRGIAQVCGELGLAFGVGSQRLLTKSPEAVETFRLRDVAPDLVILGNIGVNQARDLGVETVRHLMESISADYMAVHLNPAMELIQPGAQADRDFRQGYETIARLVEALDGRVIVKECGCGVGPRELRRLRAAGVRAVDVSGSGGTSWIKVEALRAAGQQATLGETFAEWGTPTLAATGLANDVAGLEIITSGGVDDGLKVAKAIAMGARVVGMARPVLQAFERGGVDGARAFLQTVTAGLRMTMALTGVTTPSALTQVPRIIGPRLNRWLEQADPERGTNP